jgi:hypothetical protein
MYKAKRKWNKNSKFVFHTTAFHINKRILFLIKLVCILYDNDCNLMEKDQKKCCSSSKGCRFGLDWFDSENCHVTNQKKSG